MSNKTQTLRVLFIQDSSPCIRNIKYAEALNNNGIEVHLLYRDKSPTEGYGRGDDFYRSLTRFKYRFRLLDRIKRMISDKAIDLIHYHNQPDVLGASIIKANLSVPVVFDCHDFMSFKHHLSRREKAAERTCNEESQGVIYPSAMYMEEAMKHYRFTPRRLVFGNYYPAALLVNTQDFLPKLSTQDGKIHLVFQGRIAEKHSDHRYLAAHLREFDPQRFSIHLFPSNSKEFSEYKAIPAVELHQKLPYAELMKAMTAMDYGLVMFQDSIAAKLPAIRYAFGNKTFDYLCAGLPILVQDSLDEIRNFVNANEVGMPLSSLNTVPISGQPEYQALRDRVLKIREEYSMERQIQNLIRFYQECMGSYES